MTRVGYDSDTGRYTFQDSDGSLWEGPEGSTYGVLKRAGTWNPGSTDADATQPQAVMNYYIDKSNKAAWRNFAPFGLLVILVLLLLFRFLDGGSNTAGGIPTDSDSTAGTIGIHKCGQGQAAHVVKKDDTCWDIRKVFHMTEEELFDINDGLDCDALQIGHVVCVTNP
jgi:hypothetical protein